MIPYGRQDISKEDVEAVLAVLGSDYLTQGPRVPGFEEKVARYCRVSHAVACNSATSALHLACMALGLGKGGRLWTSPITFVASANCALYCGAEVDFVDIDPRTFNICADAFADKLEKAVSEGKVPDVLVAVHMCGQSPDMQRIHDLASRYGIKIIEDASHGIGAGYLGEPVGNCRYSDITVFSFHPVKIITTAEGGVATTADAGLAQKMSMLRTHGITRDENLMENTSHGPWYYEQTGLGLNYRLTELQAALGTSQMDRLDDFVARRRVLAARYDSLLADLPVDIPWQNPDTSSSWHLYVIRLKGLSIEAHRQAHETMRAAGILVNLHYIPVPMQPYYRRMGFDPAQWPEACAYYREAMSLPLYPGLEEANQDKVVESLRKILA